MFSVLMLRNKQFVYLVFSGSWFQSWGNWNPKAQLNLKKKTLKNVYLLKEALSPINAITIHMFHENTTRCVSDALLWVPHKTQQVKEKKEMLFVNNVLQVTSDCSLYISFVVKQRKKVR